MPMDHAYAFLCGLLWSKVGDLRAGWELIAGLQSYDPDLRQLSFEMLARRPEGARQLLRDAVDFGVLLPEDGWQGFHTLAKFSDVSGRSPAGEIGQGRQNNEFPVRLGSDR